MSFQPEVSQIEGTLHPIVFQVASGQGLEDDDILGRRRLQRGLQSGGYFSEVAALRPLQSAFQVDLSARPLQELRPSQMLLPAGKFFGSPAGAGQEELRLGVKRAAIQTLLEMNDGRAKLAVGNFLMSLLPKIRHFGFGRLLENCPGMKPKKDRCNRQQQQSGHS
jgi:hypothetical protein